MNYVSLHDNENSYLKTHVLHKPLVPSIYLDKLVEKVSALYKEKDYLKEVISPNDYNATLTRFYKQFSNVTLFKPASSVMHYHLKGINIYCRSEDSIKQILKRTEIFARLTDNLNKELHIYLDLNERKRDLPKLLPSEELDKLGMGLTTAGLTSGKNIIVTKKEESVKLLLHELFHFYDLQPEADDSFIQYVKKKWNTSDTYHVYEAHCELMAIIFHCIFLACDTVEYNHLPNSSLLSLFYHFLHVERNYSLLLTTKLLKIHNYNDCSKFFIQKDKNNTLHIPSIAAYNITRGILFYYLHDFLHLLDDTMRVKEGYVQKVIIILEKIYTDKSYFSDLFDNSKTPNIRYIAQDINYKIDYNQ